MPCSCFSAEEVEARSSTARHTRAVRSEMFVPSSVFPSGQNHGATPLPKCFLSMGIQQAICILQTRSPSGQIQQNREVKSSN